MIRDFTYIDDIVESILRLKNLPEKEIFPIGKSNPNESWAPFKIFNVGNSNLTLLMDFINALENTLEKQAIKKYHPLQPGDVPSTESITNH